MKNEAFDVRDVVQRLIAEESRAEHSSDKGSRAAFRVCDKLRKSLSTLVGTTGFRLLLIRALNLAKAEAAGLDNARINPNGTVEFASEIESGQSPDDASRGETALMVQLLGLLVTFIGATLTRSILQDVWPEAALIRPESGEDKS